MLSGLVGVGRARGRHGRATGWGGRLPHAVSALAVVAATVLFGAVGEAGAATLPAGFTEQVVASGLANPTAMELAPDGRLFVAEQGGQLRVIKNGQLLATPFLTVPVSSSGERGLLGVAFDPAFATNNFVYVYYTATTPAVHNRISRFTANGDVAVAGSETVLLDLNNLSTATNHNGGAIHFGPDGKLYAAVGENANGANAQTLSNLLGKMLRINSNGTIPADNPFSSTATGVNKAIWALGLRNPFTFSFQPGTGRMFINDVGQSTWEEIDEGIAGSNYGWPDTEGPTTDPRFRGPIHYYGHGSSATTGCAISGGAFYNPPTAQFPSDYVGDYFFSDYCSGWIRKLDPAGGNTVVGFATGISSPVDLKVAGDGSLWYLARGSGSTTGTVTKITSTASQAPAITAQPASRTVSAGQPATFSVAASGTPPLSYQWQRNGVDIPGATASAYTLGAAQQSDDGARFRARVTNSAGSATSNEAVLTVVANTAPTATITQPANGTQYSAGDTITYAGTGTDTQDGDLPASAFTWEVVFHHDTHTHPFLAPTSGSKTGSFTIPNRGETAANVWYRIHLTVTDSGGLTHSVFSDVVPRTATLQLATNPSGLQVTLDGQPVTAPASVTSVVGMIRSLGAPSPQTVGTTTWQFGSWSDGGAATHEVTTPATATTYTATYGAVPTAVTASPGSTTLQAGTLRGGTAASLSADDNNYFEVTSRSRTTAWYGSFTGVPNSLRNLKVTYQGKSSQTCTQTLYVYRWTTGTWVQLDTRSVGTTEVAVANVVPPGTLADYVSGTSGDGELRVRVRCRGATGASFFTSGDLLRIAYERP